MRMMMKVTVPVEAGNRAIADGTLPKTIEAAMESLKPEAAYFVRRVASDLRGSFLTWLTSPIFPRLQSRSL